MKKMLILGMLMISILAMTGCNSNHTQTEGETTAMNTYRQITMNEAKDMMVTEKNYILLDVRTYDEYNEGHIPGAICIPNETIGTEAPSELPNKDQLIMVYCRSGNRSKQASEKLVLLGYTNVVEFGGIRDWDGEVVKE